MENKNSFNNTGIFTIFTKLLSDWNKPEKNFVRLLAELKNSDQKIGTSSPVQYSGKRLIRGLASEKHEVKAVCFACIAAALDSGTINIEDIKSTLEREEKNHTLSKSDQGALFNVILLTCGSIINSTIFAQLDQQDQQFVINKLLSVSNTKSYLKNATNHFLLIVLDKSQKDKFKHAIWPQLKEFILLDLPTYSPLLALIYLKYPKLAKKVVEKNYGNDLLFFNKVLGEMDYQAEKFASRIFRGLCDIFPDETLLKLWNTLLDRETKSTPKRDLFILTFAEVIIDTMSVSFISKLFSDKLLPIVYRSLKPNVGQSASKNVEEKRLLKGRSILNNIVDKLKNDGDDQTRLMVLHKFLLHPGDMNFERKTGSNCVQTIFQQLGANAIKELCEILRKFILGEMKAKVDVNLNNKEKQICLHLYTKLLTSPTVGKDTTWRLEQLKFLFDFSYNKLGDSNLSLKISSADCFFKAIELPSWSIEDAVHLLEQLVEFVDHLNLPQTKDESWKAMRNITEKLKLNSQRTFVAVRLLFLHMGLLLFKETELGQSAINELIQCYERLSSTRVETNDEPHWIEVAIDLFLSMLSQDNKIFRHLIGCVFKYIAPQITPSGVQQIVDALDPSSRNDVLKHVDSDDSMDEDDDDDNGDELSNGDDDDDDDDDDNDDDDDDENDNDNEKETVNDKLRMAVRNALGYSAAFTDDESVDMDNMDEDEGRRLNESLGNAFKMFRTNNFSKGSKKKQSRDDEAVTHFRTRVLDLVEIILSTNMQMCTCLDLLEPLFVLLEFSIKDPHQKPLQNRLVRVLRKLANIKKFADVSSVSYETIKTLFMKLVNRDVSAMIIVEMVPSIAECCTFLVRCSIILSPDKNEKLFLEDMYIQLIDKHFKETDRKIFPAYFQSVLKILWIGNWKIANKLLCLLVEKDLRLFNKLKIIELLEVFYKNDRLHGTATDDEKTKIGRDEMKFVETFPKALIGLEKKAKLLSGFCTKIFCLKELIVRCRSKFRKDQDELNWKDTISALVKYKHLISQKKTKRKLLSLAKEYSVESSCIEDMVVGEEPSNCESKEEKKKIKKKRSGDFKKMKENTRRLREDFNSGLQDIPFSELGYANELGEAFRPLVHRYWVYSGYGVASLYVVADTLDKTWDAHVKEKRQKTYSGKNVAVAAFDTLLWQTLASIVIPGYTINRACRLSLYTMEKMTKLAVQQRNWRATLFGLAVIPFIVKPIDTGVDKIMDWGVRPWINSTS